LTTFFDVLVASRHATQFGISLYYVHCSSISWTLG